MALLLLRLFIVIIPAAFVANQIVMPLWRGDPILPVFKKSPQLVKEAEQELLEAQSAKKAAELHKEAARIHEEAWSITEETYNTGDTE